MSSDINAKGQRRVVVREFAGGGIVDTSANRQRARQHAAEFASKLDPDALISMGMDFHSATAIVWYWTDEAHPDS